ncbi:unnamed protein product, partial [Didymodactylos carnosus]
DDSDITIINPSITSINPHNGLLDVDQRSDNNHITTTNYANQNREYVFIDNNDSYDSLWNTLCHYRSDLKNQNINNYECDRSLIIRLIDILRSIVSSPSSSLSNDTTTKTNEIQLLSDDINQLIDQRQKENNENTQQSHIEICQLKRALMNLNNVPSSQLSSFAPSILKDTQEARLHDEEITAMINESERLHNLVQKQRDQINELIFLITNNGIVSNSLLASVVATTRDINKETIGDNSKVDEASSLVSSIIQPNYSPNNKRETTFINYPHSPGTSPTHSLTSLLTESMNSKVSIQTTVENELVKTESLLTDDNTQSVFEPVSSNEQERISIENRHDQQHQTVVEPKQENEKKCPICNIAFPLETNDEQMYEHVETCLSLKTENKTFVCPQCTKKFPSMDEIAYMQHLVDCMNRNIMDPEQLFQN